MADEKIGPMSIEAISRENLSKMTVAELEEILNYTVSIRQTLMDKMGLVAAVKEEKEAESRLLVKAKAFSASEREALKQMLNGDHFKETGKSEAGNAA